jgi:hypothetical protein
MVVTQVESPTNSSSIEQAMEGTKDNSNKPNIKLLKAKDDGECT